MEDSTSGRRNTISGCRRQRELLNHKARPGIGLGKPRSEMPVRILNTPQDRQTKKQMAAWERIRRSDHRKISFSTLLPPIEKWNSYALIKIRTGLTKAQRKNQRGKVFSQGESSNCRLRFIWRGKLRAEGESPVRLRALYLSKENKNKGILGKAFACKEDCEGIFRL